MNIDIKHWFLSPLQVIKHLYKYYSDANYHNLVTEYRHYCLLFDNAKHGEHLAHTCTKLSLPFWCNANYPTYFKLYPAVDVMPREIFSIKVRLNWAISDLSDTYIPKIIWQL